MTGERTFSGRKHVLVVDDDPAIRGLLGAILDRAGYRQSTVGSCPEALAVVSEGTVDLVIADVVLGSGGGDTLELVDEIRVLQPNSRNLFISGYSARWAPGDDAAILAKPFTPQELLARVASLLQPLAA